MAYPFIPLPSLGKFISRLTSDEYGAKIKTINMTGPRGQTEIKVLVRETEKGKQKLAVIPDLKDDDILSTQQ